MYKREPQTVACVAGDFVWLIEQANRRQGTGNVGFFCSVNHLSGRLRKKCLVVIGAFRSTLFVSVFQGSLLVIAFLSSIGSVSNLFLRAKLGECVAL